MLLVQAVKEVPDSLVRELEGNDSMRSKFEALCRQAQNDICKQIEELDGEGKVTSILLYTRCYYHRYYLCRGSENVSGGGPSMVFIVCCWGKLLVNICWGRFAPKSAAATFMR